MQRQTLPLLAIPVETTKQPAALVSEPAFEPWFLQIGSSAGPDPVLRGSKPLYEEFHNHHIPFIPWCPDQVFDHPAAESWLELFRFVSLGPLSIRSGEKSLS